MIVEQLPEVQKLSFEDKLVLAAELFEEAADRGAEAPDQDLVVILNERLAAYRGESASRRAVVRSESANPPLP